MEKDPAPPRPSSLGAGPWGGATLPDRDRLLELIVDLAVVHGKVTLSSGQEADWYIDMRRLTLHHEGAPLVGRVMRQLTGDLRYDVVGGLTLGADPVATAMLHAASDGAGFLDACVVRKEGKAHRLQPADRSRGAAGGRRGGARHRRHRRPRRPRRGGGGRLRVPRGVRPRRP